ncbi:Equilibrative nucleotide transporter 2 [Platanthera zijinensis]|uniref:Equilibrative nucleotide transporter 2 n=1 Tax=Platanthera zijinensis TaxID=2320716 RepID=A0AAP0GEJ2_9ASPA
MFQLDLGTFGRGGIVPFIGICIISAAFGVVDGHIQGGMVGDLAIMQSDFIQVISLYLCRYGVGVLSLVLRQKGEKNIGVEI